MKLEAVRLVNFRSILDSGWIDIDPVTGVVGENESGKTSFLLGISRLAVGAKFEADDQSLMVADSPEVFATFKLSSSDLKRIARSIGREPSAGQLELQKNSAGRYSARIGDEQLFVTATTRKLTAGEGP